jgi:hypothetical protein
MCIPSGFENVLAHVQFFYWRIHSEGFHKMVWLLNPWIVDNRTAWRPIYQHTCSFEILLRRARYLHFMWICHEGSLTAELQLTLASIMPDCNQCVAASHVFVDACTAVRHYEWDIYKLVSRVQAFDVSLTVTRHQPNVESSRTLQWQRVWVTIVLHWFRKSSWATTNFAHLPWISSLVADKSRIFVVGRTGRHNYVCEGNTKEVKAHEEW